MCVCRVIDSRGIKGRLHHLRDADTAAVIQAAIHYTPHVEQQNHSGIGT